MSTRTKTVLAFLPSADFVASKPGGRDTASRQGGAFAEDGDRLLFVLSALDPIASRSGRVGLWVSAASGLVLSRCTQREGGAESVPMSSWTG